MKTAPSRLLWVDFLRGLAVLGMVEAHSVNSFLDPIYRTGPFFACLSYLNGWVAPTFLFIAGLLQGAALRRNWESPRPTGPRLRSLGIILLIGYGLQFPWDALLHFSSGGMKEIYHALGRIDVLHCLAVSLALFLVIAGAFKKLIHYERAVLCLTMAIVLAGPPVWQALAQHRAANPMLEYLSPAGGALFPLIPWSAFVGSGIFASRWIGNRAALGGLCLSAAALGWSFSLVSSATLLAQPYAVRYDVFFFRLSLVIGGCFLCSLAFSGKSQIGWLRRMILWCGMSSLGLYVWHLVLLHSGLGLIPSLISLFPKHQNPGAVSLLFLLTLSGSVLLTWGWQSILKKLRSPRAS